ncbi:MAG TPA: hypothetical protein PKN14_07635, partial [Bacteroidia bacterium]|nr:hypothetical protein [Bacteroidia bacterium]
MKKIVALFLITSACLAQNQNNIWCFGDSAGIDFTNINTPVSINTGMDGRGSCASIADSAGNLLFYAFTRAAPWLGNFTGQVFNSQHQIMQNGDTVQGEAWYNELTIIPKPNSNNLYYLFSMSETNVPTQGMWYSLVDMNANGGLGSVIVKNVRMNNFRNADCVTAIKHGNGRDWWVFSKYSTNSTSFNRFYTYLVTPDTIMPPIIQNLNNATDVDVQRIIFSPDGNKMMQINVFGFMCEYDFDRCTGLFSNPQLIYTEQTGNYNRLFWSGAYSSDGTKFYASTQYYFGVDTCYLVQYDLTSGNISASADTLFRISYPQTFVQAGGLRLAPDNKIYFACIYWNNVPNGYPYPDSVRNIYNENLGVINFPDSAGVACDFQPFSFYLGGKRTYVGLPNNPDYNLDAVMGSPCDTLSVGISETEITNKALLLVFYNAAAEKLFINAQNFK